MKIQIETTEKVIRVQQEVILKDLLEELEKLLPNGLWKEYKLDQNTTIWWQDPIYIYPSYQPQVPFYESPEYKPYTTCNVHNTTYCIETVQS